MKKWNCQVLICLMCLVTFTKRLMISFVCAVDRMIGRTPPLKKFAAVKNHLKNFRSELSFDFFDEEGLTEYVQYLREVREMRNSTIGKQLSFLKWFLRWSFKQGMHSNNAYDTFKPKLKDTQKKIIFLTWEELNNLREFKIPPMKQALERVRDVFLFQCFTGLRYSDVSIFAEATSKEVT